jgi:acyl-CoA dehydrogenase
MDEIRHEVRKLLSGFGPDYFRERDRDRDFPEAVFRAVGEAGYYGTLIPQEYGGVAAGVGPASILVEEVNRSGGDATAVHAQMAICGTLIRDGSEEQRRRYLPAIARGELRMLSVAATEPDSGADMTTLKSTARRDGESWVVNAQKVLISMAEHTDLMLLLTQADEGPTLFLIDMREHRASIQIHPIELIAHRMTTTLFVDELKLPDSARVGPPGHGLRCLMKGFAPRRAMAAAECIGNARFMLDHALEHARTRKVRGTLIGEHQGVSYPLTQAYARVEAADLMRWDAIRSIDAGEDADGRSALAKILASEAAWETARAALTAFGGWGLGAEYHVERKLRESTVFVFNNLLLSLVAKRVLGLP